jgi:hypothetical protein
VVIGFIFTYMYADQEQLAANLYHEHKSNFADRHQLHLRMIMQLLHDHGRLYGNIYVLITIHFVLFYRMSKLLLLWVVVFMVLTTKVNFGFSAGISDKCLQCICDVSVYRYLLKIMKIS